MTSGGAGGEAEPTSSGDVFFDAASGAVTVTVAVTDGLCHHLNFTGFTGTFAGAQRVQLSGNLTVSATMTWTHTDILYFDALSGTQTITSNGKTLTSSITLSGSDVTTHRIEDALTISGTLTVATGTLNANTFNVTCQKFASSGTATRTILMSTGIWTLTGTGTVWDTSTTTNLTVTPSTSTIKITDASATVKTFSGGGKTFNNIWLTGAGTGAFRFVGSNTFNNFKLDTPPHTVQFTAGTTTTVTTFTVAGSLGNQMTIGSITAATHTLTKAGGGTISVSYCTISYSGATPAATWDARGQGNVNGGYNSGWIFSPVSGFLAFM